MPPIHHMLYRCPRCGHDPLLRLVRRAECPDCGTVFERGKGSDILIRTPGSPTRVSTARELLVAASAMVDDSLDECMEGDAPIHQARVAVGRAEGQDIVRFNGHVLGFSERIKSEGKGILRLYSDRVIWCANGNDPVAWPLEVIRAIQISSRAIQVRFLPCGLRQFEFLEDSPKRWEDLFRLALQRFYAARGEIIVEFQPQIVTESLP
jgi:DNA-directed RNA polymerase subunit RPC12/RpoP